MNPTQSVHERHLRRCIELASLARQQGNTPVGSVVVLDGRVIGEGVEQLPAGQLLTGHAEIIACQQAVEKTGSRILRGATLYSTAEPCFMCSYVIRQAEIGEVIYAVATPKIGGATSEFPILIANSLNEWKPAVRVVGGVLANECR
ncbi:MAG: nucleoside deaminase [Pirellulales bacterium]